MAAAWIHPLIVQTVRKSVSLLCSGTLTYINWMM